MIKHTVEVTILPYVLYLSYKYFCVLKTHSFAPVAVETLGVWGADAEELLGELGRRLSEASQDTRAKSFFRQLVDVAVQRGKAL